MIQVVVRCLGALGCLGCFGGFRVVLRCFGVSKIVFLNNPILNIQYLE